MVRRELRAFHGREIATAGDGFFALFEAPERAVRCAESIVAAVGSLGLQVRAGVHTGECEVIGGGVGGMAVHIGSRVAALAGPGEVLVTGSVRDLMTGSDRHFAGGEPRELKGVADRWPVYRLVPDEVNGEALASRRPSMMPLYTRRQRRRLVAGLAAVLVVALAVTGFYVLTHAATEVVVGENAVGVIDHGDAARASAAVEVGQRPTGMAFGFGSVWVTNSTDGSVSRIDRRGGNSVPISVGASPSGVAVGAGAVWVANSGDATVSKIDPATSRRDDIRVRPGPTGIVVAFGSVWVTNALDATVTEIDPDTNKVKKVVPVGAGPTGIASGAGYLWVTNQGDDTVTRFDPDTYVADSAINVGTAPAGIAVADGAAWVANNLEGSLSRIDVENLRVTVRTLDEDGGAYGVAASEGNVWVSNEYAGTLMRVTARTFRLADTVRLRGAPLGLAFAGDDLWFTSAEGGSAFHSGGVLTMVTRGVVYDDDPPVFDPLTQYDQFSFRLAAVTNDGLVGLRRAGGIDGSRLVPDLATALPEPTDGGLTYTLHLRKGVRYSTGDLVLAGDIRRGIERTVVHPDTAADYDTRAIVGAQTCRDAAEKALATKRPRPDCDLSKGIRADDRTGTITFHLTRPTPQFRYQLGLPNASAVPQDTPVDLKPGTFLPATGPYQIRSYTPKQDAVGGHGRLELVRNPYFHVWSPAAQPDGYPDRIVLRTGYTDQEAETRVIDGRADLLWLGAYTPGNDVDMLKARYRSQLHTHAGGFVASMFLNATKPPFTNRDARRAVAYALDRAGIIQRNNFEGRVTCQLIPPLFPAYKPYCPFTLGGDDNGEWNGPDVATAHDLVRKSGTRGAKVVFGAFDNTIHKTAGRLVVATLHELGYRASLQVVSDTDWPGKDWNIAMRAYGADYPAPASYLASLASCDPDLKVFNLSGYCDAKLDKQIAAALERQVSEPGGAADAWAAIDRRVVDAAAIIPFWNGISQDFVSRRVGNVLVHPATGPLIAQMWVK